MGRKKKTDDSPQTPGQAAAKELFEALLAEYNGDVAAVIRAMNGPDGLLDRIVELADEGGAGAAFGVGGADPLAGSARRSRPGLARIVPEVSYTLPDPPDEVSTYRVRIDIDEARPPIWRRLDLAGDLTLEQVHLVIQLAFGWTSYHLHSFTPEIDGAHDRRAQPFANEGTVEFSDGSMPEEGLVRLDQVVRAPGDRLFYEYDFGDGWGHTLEVEKVLPRADGDPLAASLDGRRSGPPEDAGGIWRYNELVAALAGEASEIDARELAELRDWLPPGFDPENAALDGLDLDGYLRIAASADQLSASLPGNPRLAPACAELVAAAEPMGILPGLSAAFVAAGLPLEVEPPSAALATVLDGLTPEEAEAALTPLRTLLTTIGPEGTQLTAAGYLRPAIVETLFTSLNMADEWIGKGNREDQTLPVLQLRESATALGLVRKSKGRLLPTKAATSDPIRMWRHVASRLTSSTQEIERHAAVLALLTIAAHHTAAGPPDDSDQPRRSDTVQAAYRELAADTLTMLGWSSAGGPLSVWQVWHLSDTVWAVFRHPACITADGQVTPFGRRLAKAALLAG